MKSKQSGVGKPLKTCSMLRSHANPLRFIARPAVRPRSVARFGACPRSARRSGTCETNASGQTSTPGKPIQ